MAKVTEAQRKQIEEALAHPNETPLPENVVINFGADEPYQKNTDAVADDKKPDK